MKRYISRTLISAGCKVFLVLILGSVAFAYAQQDKREQEARPQKQEQQARPEQQQQQQEQRQQEKGQQEQRQQQQEKGKQEQPEQQAKPEKQEQQPQSVVQQKQQQEKPKTKKIRIPKQQDKSTREQQAKNQQDQQPSSAGLQKQQQSKDQQQPQTKSQPVQKQQGKGLQKQQQPVPAPQPAQPAKQVKRVQQSEQQEVWTQHRAHSWQSEHRTWEQRGGYNGYRIPDDHFSGYFGRDHGFRIYSLSLEIYGGYPRFQYEGYWFSVVDPWPEYWSADWYENDDVYIDYSGDGYYLYNRRYPRDRIAVTVYMN